MLTKTEPPEDAKIKYGAGVKNADLKSNRFKSGDLITDDTKSGEIVRDFSWQPRTLREAVMLTLAFFDAQDMAVTAFEVWQNLIGWSADYLEVTRVLEHDPLIKKNLFCRDGFYRLGSTEAGSPEVISRRFNNIKTCERYFKVARRVTRWLVFVPFVTSVSVVNNVAAGNANAASDIDFFVTASPGFLWLARFLTTGVVHLLRKRKHGARHAGRVCLSFFAVNTALDLEPFAIDGGDFYLAHWINNLAPLYDRVRVEGHKDTTPGEHSAEKYRAQSGKSQNIQGKNDLLTALAQKNLWVREIFPQARPRAVSVRRQVSGVWLGVARPVRQTAEFVLRRGPGRYLEKKIKEWQLKRMGKSVPYERKSRTVHVVITDEVLKFHEEDRRAWFREKTLATFERLKKGWPLESGQAETLQGRTLPRRTAAGVFIEPVGDTVVGAGLGGRGT